MINPNLFFMKNLLIALSAVFIMSCNKDNNTAGVSIYSVVEFSIFNSENEDILDPDNPDHIDESNFEIFYEIEGEKVEFYKTINPGVTLDYGRGFKIYEHENEFRIAIFINHDDSSAKPITYVHWNDNDIDTIKATFNRRGGSIIQEIIWLNGEKVWEIGDNTKEPYFTLIK